MVLNEERKSYSMYKDGLPVVNLSKSQLRRIGEGFCIKTKSILINGQKIKVRVRIKPKKKITLIQENARLRKLLKEALEGKRCS